MTESLFDAALEAAQKDEPAEDLSPKAQTLLEIGHLKSTVQIGNNEVVIKTLTIGEELEAAVLANKYKETLEEGRALMTAVVSSAIVSVNGRPLQGETLGMFQETPESRYTTVRQWYWTVVRDLYSEYLALTDQVYKEYEQLKKA